MNTIILRISIRNLLKNKFVSFICVFGLSLGFIAYILISLFIRYEYNWDKANENYSNIYMVQRNVSLSAQNIGSNNISPFTPATVAPLIRNYPGFEKTTRIHEVQDQVVSINQNEYIKVDKGIYADLSLFNIFTYSFNGIFALESFNKPFTVVVSKTLAHKLFGNDNVIGKTISLDKKIELNVVGVYDDLPKNSSVRPEFIISFSTLEKKEGFSQNDLWTISCLTFTLLEPTTNPKVVESNIKDLFTEYDGRELETLQLSPLSKTRFESVPDYVALIWLFGLIGLIILAMSAFNYVNLLIANASMRSKEIAIKKMNGSGRFYLVKQFLGETMLLSTLAIAISFYLVTFLLPIYNSIMNTSIKLNFYNDWKFILLIVTSSLVIGLIAGSYPAFIMSSKKIGSLFKPDSIDSKSSKIKIRKALVLLQFSISIFLICLSLLFLNHVKHISNKDIGFERDNLLYIEIESSAQGRNFEDFKARILQNPKIISASMSKNLPFVNFNFGNIDWEGATSGDRINYRPNWVSFDFIQNMKIKLAKGRDFSRDYPTDLEQACIINETAVRYFGWDNPIGKRVDNNQYTVIGVVKDYHVMDIHNLIDPVVIKLTSGEMSGSWVYSFRYVSGYRDEAKKLIIEEFNQAFPTEIVEVQELDNAFRNENAFKTFQTIKKSILFFTAISIFLAITGLLGLVSFSTAKRTKEIGMRKILGSSIPNIFLLLNREFFILLGISFVIAWPLVWFVWDSFPGVYKLPAHPWVFIFSGIITLFITLLTTGWQTWRAASRNPIESLRYE